MPNWHRSTSVFETLCRPVRRKKVGARIDELSRFGHHVWEPLSTCTSSTPVWKARKIVDFLTCFWPHPCVWINFLQFFVLCCVRSLKYFGLCRLKMEPWGHRFSHGFGPILVVLRVGEGVNAAPRGVLCWLYRLRMEWKMVVVHEKLMSFVKNAWLDKKDVFFWKIDDLHEKYRFWMNVGRREAANLGTCTLWKINEFLMKMYDFCIFL